MEDYWLRAVVKLFGVTRIVGIDVLYTVSCSEKDDN